MATSAVSRSGRQRVANVERDIQQAAHGFVVGNVVYIENTTGIWKLATASDASKLGLYVVSRVIDVNNFSIATAGLVSGIVAGAVVGGGSLVPGEYYYVSAAVGEEGKVTATEPSISNLVYQAFTATSAFVLPFRPALLGSTVDPLIANNVQTSAPGTAMNLRTGAGVNALTISTAGVVAIGPATVSTNAPHRFNGSLAGYSNGTNGSAVLLGETNISVGANIYADAVSEKAAATATGMARLVVARPATGAAVAFEFQANTTAQTAGSAIAGTTSAIGAVSAGGGWTFGPPVVGGQNGVGHVFRTGDQGGTLTIGTANAGTIQIGNGATADTLPTIAGISNDGVGSGLTILAATSEATAQAGMIFNVRKSDNTDFSTLTTPAFIWARFSTELGNIRRDGSWTLGPDSNYTSGDSARIVRVNHGRIGFRYPSSSVYAHTVGVASDNAMSFEATWTGTESSKIFKFNGTGNEIASAIQGGGWTLGTFSTLNLTHNIISGGTCTVDVQAANAAGGDATLHLTSIGSNRGFLTHQRSSSRLYASSGTNFSGPYVAANGTSWTTGSDERIKDNIQPIADAISSVMSIRTVKFTRTDLPSFGDTLHVGVIAQDVDSVLPEAVDKSDPERWGVKYTDLIPLALAAIKELKTELDAAKARIQVLEGA